MNLFYIATKAVEEPHWSSVVLTGLAIVFGMLLLFVILFSVFGLVAKLNNNSKSKAVAPAQKPVSPVKVAATVASAAQNDDELIAVITAAVYSMYEGTTKKPIIRSIKPARSNGRSAWATAGLMNNIKSF